MIPSPRTQSANFRKAEAENLFDWIEAGESGAVVGVSGVGKSNLFNHMLDRRTADRFLGGAAKRVLLVRVNFHFLPDFSERTVLSLILEALESLTVDEGGHPVLNRETLEAVQLQHEKLLDSGNDLLKILRAFRKAFRLLLGVNGDWHLALLFDQFDDVYREAPARLFAILRGLRETYKYRLSYILFLRDMLENLVEVDDAREEFSELFTANVMGLKPYGTHDARMLLQRIADRRQQPVPEADFELLIELTGGHAGLLRATYLTLIQGDLSQPPNSKAWITALLASSAVNIECQKLWQCLSVTERRFIARSVRGIVPGDQDKEAIRSLALKGLLLTTENPALFAPLFHDYALAQESPWEQALYLDSSRQEVWVLGQRVEGIGPLEYQILQTLYMRAGEVVSRDDLIEICWAGKADGTYDQSISSAVYRLRQAIEPDHTQPRFIETLRKRGYRLKIH